MEINNDSKKIQNYAQTSPIKQYFIEKPDNISKSIARNIFRRCPAYSYHKKQKFFIFIEKFYQASIKIGFLSIKLNSILTKNSQIFICNLSKLEKSFKQKYFLHLINSLNKHTELIQKSEKLEKILKARQSKKLIKTKSDHLTEFSLNILNRVLVSSTNRLIFSSFLELRFKPQQIQFKISSNLKKVLCFTSRNLLYKHIFKTFTSIVHFSNSQKLASMKLSKLANLFLVSTGKVFETLKYFQQTPKYFLSSHWKYNNLNQASMKSLKNSSILPLTSFLSKKISCLKCFSFYKLALAQSSWISSTTPTKLNVSTDDSSMNTTIKKTKLKDFFTPEHKNPDKLNLKFFLLRLVDVIQSKINKKSQLVFYKLKKIPQCKLSSTKVSCKDLPICRKLNTSSVRNFLIKENTYLSLSPIGRKSNKK